MKLLPFKDIIAMSKEKLDAALAPVRAKQVKAKADLELCEIDTQLLTKETEVQEMCTGKDIDLKRLLDKLDEIAILERRKKQYAKVLKELFPE